MAYPSIRTLGCTIPALLITGACTPAGSLERYAGNTIRFHRLPADTHQCRGFDLGSRPAPGSDLGHAMDVRGSTSLFADLEARYDLGAPEVNDLRYRALAWERYSGVQHQPGLWYAVTVGRSLSKPDLDTLLVASSLEQRTSWLLSKAWPEKRTVPLTCCLARSGSGGPYLSLQPGEAFEEMVFDKAWLDRLTDEVVAGCSKYCRFDEAGRHDEDWLEVRQVILDFLLFHEMGHFFFEHHRSRSSVGQEVDREMEADYFAGLAMGYFYADRMAVRCLARTHRPRRPDDPIIIRMLSREAVVLKVQPLLVLGVLWRQEYSGWGIDKHAGSQPRAALVTRMFNWATSDNPQEWRESAFADVGDGRGAPSQGGSPVLPCPDSMAHENQREVVAWRRLSLRAQLHLLRLRQKVLRGELQQPLDLECPSDAELEAPASAAAP